MLQKTFVFHHRFRSALKHLGRNYFVSIDLETALLQIYGHTFKKSLHLGIIYPINIKVPFQKKILVRLIGTVYTCPM